MTSPRLVAQGFARVVVLLAILWPGLADAASLPVLDRPTFNGGTVALTLSGQPGAAYAIQASPDLVHWITYPAATLTASPTAYADPNSGSCPRLFYRLMGVAPDAVPNLGSVAVAATEVNAVDAIVPESGAALSITNASGTVCVVELPVQAVRTPTWISVKSITALSGSPFSGTLVGGVQCAPDGLKLGAPARVTLQLPAPISGQNLFAFAYEGSGTNYHLVPFELAGNSLTLSLRHFSGAGWITGTESDLETQLQRLPARRVDQVEQLAAALQHKARRADRPLSADETSQIQSALAGMFKEQVLPELRAAEQAPAFVAQGASGLAQWSDLASRFGLAETFTNELSQGATALSAAQQNGRELLSGWARLDVDHNGRLNRQDQDLIFAAGFWSPTTDVNGDGQKDIVDYWAWLLFFMRWDQNGDGLISHADFIPQPVLSLPRADAEAARKIVSELAATNWAPAELEGKFIASVTNYASLEANGQSGAFEHLGAGGLMKGQLEAAQWAFARACELNPARDSALADLGFVCCQRGDFQRGLVLLAQALALNSQAGATYNNIAWAFSRSGQLAEAEQFYRLAVQYAPRVGQYHLNLGAVLVRQGKPAEAEMLMAASLSPQDAEATLAAIAVKPATPKSLEQFEQTYEAEREQALNEDPDTPIDHWSELSFEDQIEQIRYQAIRPVEQAEDSAFRDFKDQTLARMTNAFNTAAPEWKSGIEDLNRWKENYAKAEAAIEIIANDADLRADEMVLEFARKKAGAELSMDRTILRLALVAAQQEMAGIADATLARRAFEERIDALYTRPMQMAAATLAHPSGAGHPDITPDAASLQGRLEMLPLVISMAGIADPQGYGKDMPGIGEVPEEVHVAVESAISIPFEFGKIEYTPETGEAKLQVGEGVMAAGTWSPHEGFGFQIGLGYDFSHVGLSGEQATFLKFGSDGSISIVTETSAGVIYNRKVTASQPIRAASHEPVGAISSGGGH